MSEFSGPKVVVTKNGPYQVTGGLPLGRQIIEADAAGESREWRAGPMYDAPPSYNLCRCGHSADKPFCDGTHARIHFDGAETAGQVPYLDQVDVFDGPAMELTDAGALCAFARFCDPDGQVWNLIEHSDEPDARRLVEHQSGHCPSGRLVAWDKSTREPFEPAIEPSIGLIQDPQAGVSGPIWVRGGVTIESSDGQAYEVRNRVTLCRCGGSQNKPFCDGQHAALHFDDGK